MRLIFAILALILVACKQKPTAEEVLALRPYASNYNWTGEYEFKDGEVIHKLKLLRGRVDADYQVMYTTSQSNYEGSIWKVNDFNDSIQLVFINNFTDNAPNIPFTRGDILFTLKKGEGEQISTSWYKVQPDSPGTFMKLEK
jgi:hypothetical protein